MKKKNVLFEEISSIMKLYQSDFKDTPQSEELNKVSNNPLLKFKNINIPTDSDELMKIKDVDLPEMLKNNIIDKDKAEDVSNF